MRIDLHMHSVASDGAFAPAEVVERAVAGGLDVIALADHDTADGVPDALAAAEGRLHVVPALEVSAVHRGRDLHILGYGIDIQSVPIRDYSRRARDARAQRIRDMIARLDNLDIVVDFESVLEEAGPGARSLARPHLARVLHSEGHVGSIGEAFERFIGDEGPAFVATELLDVPAAIDMIHASGGLAVWAHPPLPLLGSALTEFVEAGLDGIEVFRPRLPQPDTNRVRNKARAHDLLVTGGSDWHGDWHGDLGTFHLGRAEIAPFLDRLGL